MPQFQIDERIFEKFPFFWRGVIVANNVCNRGDDAPLRAELRRLVSEARRDVDLVDYGSHPHIAPWTDAFRNFGLDPEVDKPSIAALIEDVRKGDGLPFYDKLTAAMTAISLKYVLPIHGDDLAATKGHFSLSFAQGNERYQPLGRPDRLERPARGEVIYHDSRCREVLRRCWCWRSSHVTGILPTTTSVAIHVDGLGPVTPAEVERVTVELAQLIDRHCGGSSEVRILSREYPEVECGDVAEAACREHPEVGCDEMRQIAA